MKTMVSFHLQDETIFSLNHQVISRKEICYLEFVGLYRNIWWIGNGDRDATNGIAGANNISGQFRYTYIICRYRPLVSSEDRIHGSGPFYFTRTFVAVGFAEAQRRFAVGFDCPELCRSSNFVSTVDMAATHATLGVACPSSLCKSFFLGSSRSSRFSLATCRTLVTPPGRAFKVEAKKGEWLPGLPSPAYLDGSLPGDNGFDPLGLGEDPENLKWYVQAELQNGRWAMLGVAGMLIPDFLTKVGVLNVPAWYDAGKAEYFAPASTLFVIEFILFHYVEVRRWQDIKYPGSVNSDPFNPKLTLPPNEVGYPGGVFNPLNFPASREYKEKELANGRLAMLAFLGFLIQHNLTGKSPVEDLFQHLSDPWHNTIVQTLQGL